MLMALKETKEPVTVHKVDKNHSFMESLGYALSGIRFTLVNERNIRYQTMGFVLVMLAAWFFQLPMEKWLILILTSAIVVCMEITNTIAEWTIDLITNHHYHPIAKNVKDVAAGGVLISSMVAIIVGVMIFLPEILALF
ncbi:diacylglycerol kinase family protein [Aerococcus agrisoli]|uniref:Diacylglycerol kinase family protein n=2 Tax=Aerococcus agrisoli TaxID=2487350 RepID=A0A3N4GJR4_9LACT|nr:diacylglycerol kinase family protein [Aerococcus agrisoli]